jgi:DNA-binding transcriptional MerR regulator
VSAIKYYLREGLLEPGEKVNATTSVYAESHVERLELIHTLRQVVGLPIARVQEVVDAVREQEPVQLMGTVQTMVLDLPAAETPGAEAAPDAATDAPDPSAEDVIAALGWCEGTDVADAALDAHLRRMQTWGIGPDLDTALVYARAADDVARFELDLPQGVGAISRDRLATFVARGVYGYSQLLLRMLAVAQGSRAQREHGDGQNGGGGSSPGSGSAPES